MSFIYPQKTNYFGFRKNRSLILLLFILSSIFSLQLTAQNYVVNSNADANAVNLVTGDAGGGVITLRSAIQAATAQPGAHIITFSGAVVSPINLTLGQITVGNAANGNNITITGPGMNLLTVNQTTDNRVFSTGTGAVTFLLQNITLNFTGPGTTPYSGGGGAIIAGGAGAATTLINVTISNFDMQLGNGGAISASSSLANHSLTITNCIFTNNRAGGAGGAVSYNSQGGTAIISGCTFSGNQTGPVGANTGGDGGALSTTGGGNGGTYIVEKNTFINNQVLNNTGHGAAVINTNGILTLRFNRFIGNTCANVANPPLANIVAQTGGTLNFANTIADNNWWGVNTGPGTNDATALAAGGTMVVTQWLQLKTTASPNPICNTAAGLGNTTTVTASFLSNSAGEAIALSNLSTLIGLPVIWSSTLGNLSVPQTTIQANGTATATFTSNGTGGTATVNTQVDNIPAGETSPARASITVNIAPTVSNPANQTGCAGGNVSFTSTITGTPPPTIVWRRGTTALVNGLQASGSTVSGQGTATLTFTNVQPGDVAANYNVQASNDCGLASSANASLTVNIPSVAPSSISGTTSICAPNSTTLTAVGGVLGTGANYQWGTGNVVGTSPLTGETNASITVSPGSTTTYWVRIENNAAPCPANTSGVTQQVTINTPSIAPTGATGTINICTGTSTTLTVTGGTKGTGAETEWFTGSCGGTLVFTGDEFTTPVLNSNTTYYVRFSGTCNTTTCAEVTVTVFNREINVQGNSTTIVDGDVTASLTDHTDFGNVIITNNLVRTYTIQNTGTDDLTVGAITVSGGDAALFTVGTLSPASPIPGGGSATFTVTFAPTSTGLKTTTVTIANNDCNEAPYDFAIAGTGTCVTNPVVTNNNDAGPGSLRQAVLEACPNSTITFSGVTGTIVLTSGEIVINKNLIIEGPGENLLAISGNNSSRIFNIPNSAAITVGIKKLKITKGFAANFASGGGIVNGNAAIISLSNMIFLENSAYAGGALINDGKAILTNVVFSKNNNYGSPGGGGGAVLTGTSANETSSFTNVVFSENTTGGTGGAVVVNGRPANFINCTFYGNNAFSSGGAMYLVNGAQVQITNCIFRGNAAPLFPDINTTFNSGVPAAITTSLFGVDPLFVNAADPDGADNLWITGDDGLRIQSGSPAINTGTAASAPATDILGAARLGATDMGAYEFTCTAPVFTSCPGNQSVNNTPGLCSAVVNYTATASGTPAANYTYQFTGATTASGSGTGSGSTFNVGVTTVTITATNTCGNPTCTFTVTVVDNQPPTINCPPAIQVFGCSIAAAPPAYATIFEWAAAGGRGVENCTINNGSFKLLSEVLTTSTKCQKVYTRTYYVEDASGNSATCTQTVTVIDNTAPTGTNPSAITGVNSCTPTQAQADASFSATLAASGYTDGCGGAVTAELVSASVGGGNCGWTVTYTFRVKDLCGNYTSNQTYTRSGRDQTPPTGTNPSPVTGVNSCTPTQTQADAAFNATLAASGYRDACGGAVTAELVSASVSGGNCGWTVIYTFRVKDVCGNYTSNQTYTRSGRDQTAPVPPVFAQVLLEYKCIADIPAAPTVSGTDNCDGIVPGVLVVTNNGGTGCVSSPLIYTRTWTFTDQCGNSSTAVQTVKVVDDVAPTITGEAATPNSLWPPNHKMRDVEIKYDASDNCGTVTTTLTAVSNEPDNGTGDGDMPNDIEIVDNTHVRLRAERSGNGNGRIYTITITAKDACGNITTKDVTVVVAHNITGPVSGASFKVGSTVNFAGTFWDKPGNRHTATWSIDGTSVTGTVVEPSGLRNGTVTGSYKFNSPGVYKLQMNVKDQTGVVSYANTQGDLDAIVVIYDPNGGYTYGGGWFGSPAGSLRTDGSATGKVSFGFNSNYYKNATNPKGETQMQFMVGDLEFNALNFEYLSISGAKAQYKGSGKIKGDKAGYSFIMTVIDGALNGTGTDKIRLKIFNKNTGEVIYDNQPGASDAADPTTVIGSGSTIVVVNPNASAPATKTMEEKLITAEMFDAKVLPNPAIDQFILRVKTTSKEPVHVRVVDIMGRKLTEMKSGSDQTIQFGRSFIPGIYFVEIIQGTNRKVIKLEKL